MTIAAKRVKVAKTINDVAHEQSLQIQRASTGLSTLGKTNIAGGNWVKRDTANGRIMDQKTNALAPFKGIRRER